MKTVLSMIMVVVLALSACKSDEVNTNRIYVFSQPGCGHCVHAKTYMERYYKDYDIKDMNIREGENMSHMRRYARKFKVPEYNLGTPFIVLGDNYVMGWGDEQIKSFNRYARRFKPKQKIK